MTELMSLRKKRFLQRGRLLVLSFLIHTIGEAPVCDKQRLKPWGWEWGEGKWKEREEEEGQLKMFEVLKLQNRNFPFLMSYWQTLLPTEGGFPCPRSPFSSCRDPPPCFDLRKARRCNQNLGRETEKRWRCGREVESESTAGSAGNEGRGDRKGTPWSRGRQFLEHMWKDQVGSLFANL